MYVKEFDVYLPVSGRDVCEWCIYRSGNEPEDREGHACEYHKALVSLVPKNFRLVECVNAAGGNNRVFEPDGEKIETLLESYGNLRAAQRKYF
jgi:hypothetical protein